MEIKYEAVFGDQSLFDNDIGDSVAAINHGDVVFCFNSYNAFLIEVMKCNDLPLSDIPEFAMRRIIKEPKRWTWEDKKAGVLPEVGAKCSHCHSVDERTVLLVTDKYVGIERDNSDMNPYFVTHAEFLHYYIPIETPEEKAARLREEWVDSAITETEKRKDTTTDEYERLKARVKDIYDALLSGELPVPKKGGE